MNNIDEEIEYLEDIERELLQEEKNIKRNKIYKKSIKIYSLILAIISILSISYVYGTLELYENSIAKNYITDFIESDKITRKIDNNMFKISKLEKINDSISSSVKNNLEKNEYEIVKNNVESKNDIYVYDIKIENNNFVKLTLKKRNSYKKLGILTINDWEILRMENNFENGIYSYSITIPPEYKLYINNTLVTEEYISKETDDEDLIRLKDYTDIRKDVTYTIKNLLYEPRIEIKDENNKQVNFKKDTIINIEKEKNYIPYEEMKLKMKKEFNILDFEEKWSLYLTDDLPGRYNTIKEYTIPGSYIDQMAYGWATNRDITFVSNHNLKPNTFTNEKIENCMIHNENTFSCEVTLEKNMIVSGRDRKDTIHDRLYFIYHEDNYKIIDMKSI